MSAEVAEAAGEVAKTIEALLRASMQSCSLQDSVDEAVIGFVAESVAASVETGEMLSSGEALSLFQDAGLQTAGLDEATPPRLRWGLVVCCGSWACVV